MVNTFEQINSSLVTQFKWNACLTKIDYGLIFCYVIMSVCIIVGTPGHLWCLWLYLSFNGKIKQTPVFLLNHTVMELLTCILCFVELLNEFIFMNNYLFLVTAFVYGLSWSGRPIIQTCICIEQYFAVLHPVTFLKYKGLKYRIAAVSAAWILASGYGLHGVLYLVAIDPIFNSILIMAVAVISFCCVSVLCALKHPSPGDTQITTQPGRDVRNRQKKDAFNTIFTLLLLVLLTYVPQGFLSIFTVVKISWVILYCNLTPFLMSLSLFSLIITPLLKMYKEGYLTKKT